jgi:hypothetical protein
MQFYLHIYSIYNRSYGWDALQTVCLMAHKLKNSAHRKAQRFE